MAVFDQWFPDLRRQKRETVDVEIRKDGTPTMRLPRMPPFLWKMVAVVLAVGAVIGMLTVASLLLDHRESCQKIAGEHAFMEGRISEFIKGGAKLVPAYDDEPFVDARELLALHRRLRKVYETAAWRFTAPIPPHPSSPWLAPGTRP